MPFFHLNSTSAVCPSRLTRSAVSPISEISGDASGLMTCRVSAFHFLAFPMMHFHRQVSVVANMRLYSTGYSGSRQKISITAPVSLWKCILAGTTLVSLKTMGESAGRSAGKSRKMYSRILPLSYSRSLDASRSASGYLAIRSSGRQ